MDKIEDSETNEGWTERQVTRGGVVVESHRFRTGEKPLLCHDHALEMAHAELGREYVTLLKAHTDLVKEHGTGMVAGGS